MFRIIFVFTVATIVFQLYEACTTHKDCTSGAQACLGPAGQKECFNCPCNKTSQCTLNVDSSVKCDCTNSGGYTGASCDCPPQQVYQDFVPLEGKCLEFTDQFIRIKNVYFTPDVVPSGKSIVTEHGGCEDECLRDTHCFIFYWGYYSKNCYKYNTTNVYKVKNFFRYIVVRFGEAETLNMRYCFHYDLGEDGELFV